MRLIPRSLNGYVNAEGILTVFVGRDDYVVARLHQWNEIDDGVAILYRGEYPYKYLYDLREFLIGEEKIFNFNEVVTKDG